MDLLELLCALWEGGGPMDFILRTTILRNDISKTHDIQRLGVLFSKIPLSKGQPSLSHYSPSKSDSSLIKLII